MNQSRYATAALILGVVLSPGIARAAPSPNDDECVAAHEKSIKLEDEQRLGEELAQLVACAAESCPEMVRNECRKRVEQLNQAMPSVVFEVKDARGADVSQVKVTMDGQLLTERVTGEAHSLDPGEHQFVFEVEGQAPIVITLVIRVSEKNRRESVVFPGLNQQPQPLERNGSLSQQQIGALVAGGTGVVGLVISAVFWRRAASQKSDAEDLCPGSICPSKAGSDAWHDAKVSGNVSTVAFVVGGVCLAGGAALWFTGKPRSGEQPQVGLGLSGIQFRGAF